MGSRTIEILTCTLPAGAGANFHETVRDQGIPLHQAAGLDVVNSGAARTDADCNVLIRRSDSPEYRSQATAAFYSSKTSIDGPRCASRAAIACSTTIVMHGSAWLVAALRQRPDREASIL